MINTFHNKYVHTFTFTSLLTQDTSPLIITSCTDGDDEHLNLPGFNRSRPTLYTTLHLRRFSQTCSVSLIQPGMRHGLGVRLVPHSV